MSVPAYDSHVVNFEKPDDIIPVYTCEDCEYHIFGDHADDLLEHPHNGDACPKCGSENLYPTSCNYRVICLNGCEHDGCDAADCCAAARQFVECRSCGGPASVVTADVYDIRARRKQED